MKLSVLGKRILENVAKHGDAEVSMLGITIQGSDGNRYRVDGDVEGFDIIRDCTVDNTLAVIAVDYLGEHQLKVE